MRRKHLDSPVRRDYPVTMNRDLRFRLNQPELAHKELATIHRLSKECGGNLDKIAHGLGVCTRTLYRLIDQVSGVREAVRGE